MNLIDLRHYLQCVLIDQKYLRRAERSIGRAQASLVTSIGVLLLLCPLLYLTLEVVTPFLVALILINFSVYDLYHEKKNLKEFDDQQNSDLAKIQRLLFGKNDALDT